MAVTPLPKFSQLIPLVQQHDDGIITNYLLALSVTGDLYLIHLPWEDSGYKAFRDNPTVQVRPVNQDFVNWTE